MLDLRNVKLKTTDVELPELGGSVRLRQLGAVAFAATQAKLPEDPTSEQVTRFNVELLAQMVVDDSGVTYLDSDEGRAILAGLPLTAMLELGQAAADLNGTSKKKN